LPKYPDKPVSHALPAPDEAPLVLARDAVLKKAPDGSSAFLPLPNNRNALTWRLALIDQARAHIDLQVFIWSNDESGRLLLDRLLAAAQRGVRVRILVDDMVKEWKDRGTALVDREPNIQVRRFNPGRVRKGLLSRALHMSAQFKQLNRRMHNKQLLVDGAWAIVGGRNIGNPYYGLSKKYNNRDLDLLITGAILPRLASDFDEFWNADAAYPGAAMYGDVPPDEVRDGFKTFKQIVRNDLILLEKAGLTVNPSDWGPAFAELPGRMMMGTANVYQDSPEVKEDRGIRLIKQLEHEGPDVQFETCIVTPYMIPTRGQLENLARIIADEKRTVKILVPSMESNNHTMVHSHYKKYRSQVLRAGAELYELRGQPSEDLRALCDTAPVRSKFVSLHAKVFILDRRWVLLGSLNLDPRSININTEHMLVIDALAGITLDLVEQGAVVAAGARYPAACE
jgi:putative cardiolipin synthase